MPFKLLNHPVVPSALRGPILVDHRHVPRYWATVWSIMCGAQLAPATLTKKLRYIESLYVHADQLRGYGTLDSALANLDEVILAEVLEAWFVSIRNQPNQTDADEDRWQSGLGFVTSIVRWLSRSTVPNARLKRIEERLHRLSFLYDQLHIRRRQPSQTVRSLPANVISALYDRLDPAAASNPFPREKVRWQVYLAFFLMLHQGLRRAELLLLPVDAIKSAYDNRQQRMRYWLNVQANRYATEEDDPRYSRPSIKNAQSIRQVPVSEPVAKLVQTYVENYRGRPSHPYLLNSQKNQPLSTESITKLFAKLSTSLPDPVRAELRDRTGKESVTAHDLRHTCAVVRLNQLLQQGDAMDEALQKLRAFFGWSRESQMPLRYTRAVFEDRLSTIWDRAFDDRINLLRSIP